MSTIRPPEFPKIQLQGPGHVTVSPPDKNVREPSVSKTRQPISVTQKSQLPKLEHQVEKSEHKVGGEGSTKLNQTTINFYQPKKIKVPQPALLGQHIDITI